MLRTPNKIRSNDTAKMEPRPPADSPPTAELPSELEDITKELAALRGGVDAAIWEPREEARRRRRRPSVSKITSRPRSTS